MEILILHSEMVEASRELVADYLAAIAGNTALFGENPVTIIDKHKDAVSACPNFSAYPAIVVRDGETARVLSPAPSWADAMAWIQNPPAPAPVTLLTQFEFSQLFTAAERIAIRTASKANPAIEDAVDILNRASMVDLVLPETQAGVMGMAQAGLLTPERAADILAGRKPS